MRARRLWASKVGASIRVEDVCRCEPLPNRIFAGGEIIPAASSASAEVWREAQGDYDAVAVAVDPSQ